MQLRQHPERFIRTFVDAVTTRPFLNDLLAMRRARLPAGLKDAGPDDEPALATRPAGASVAA